LKYQVFPTVDEDIAMKGGFDRSKSLQELEQQDWGESTYHSSLVTTCHRLRRKPLNQFTVEDLRILIGQRIGLSFLLPLAVERLEEDPLAEGDFYPGDLLQAVLRAGDTFWAAHPDSFQRVHKIVKRVKHLLASLDDTDRPSVLKVLEDAPRSLAD
jgi:hypothetical protein